MGGTRSCYFHSASAIHRMNKFIVISALLSALSAASAADVVCDDMYCISCTDGEAGSCNECGYGYDWVNGACGWCKDDQCDRCTDGQDGSCTKCKEGYSLDNGGCTESAAVEEAEDSASDIVCDDMYCISCTDGEAGSCNECMEGYDWVNGACGWCKDDQCNRCTDGEDGSCTKCMEGYFLDNGGCTVTAEPDVTAPVTDSPDVTAPVTDSPDVTAPVTDAPESLLEYCEQQTKVIGSNLRFDSGRNYESVDSKTACLQLCDQYSTAGCLSIEYNQTYQKCQMNSRKLLPEDPKGEHSRWEYCSRSE